MLADFSLEVCALESVDGCSVHGYVLQNSGRMLISGEGDVVGLGCRELQAPSERAIQPSLFD